MPLDAYTRRLALRARLPPPTSSHAYYCQRPPLPVAAHCRHSPRSFLAVQPALCASCSPPSLSHPIGLRAAGAPRECDHDPAAGRPPPGQGAPGGWLQLGLHCGSQPRRAALGSLPLRHSVLQRLSTRRAPSPSPAPCGRCTTPGAPSSVPPTAPRCGSGTSAATQSRCTNAR